MPRHSEYSLLPQDENCSNEDYSKKKLFFDRVSDSQLTFNSIKAKLTEAKATQQKKSI